jgi:hypothetical protein
VFKVTVVIMAVTVTLTVVVVMTVALHAECCSLVSGSEVQSPLLLQSAPHLISLCLHTRHRTAHKLLLRERERETEGRNYSSETII